MVCKLVGQGDGGNVLSLCSYTGMWICFILFCEKYPLTNPLLAVLVFESSSPRSAKTVPLECTSVPDTPRPKTFWWFPHAYWATSKQKSIICNTLKNECPPTSFLGPFLIIPYLAWWIHCRHNLSIFHAFYSGCKSLLGQFLSFLKKIF